jgi:hypothetical protein
VIALLALALAADRPVFPDGTPKPSPLLAGQPLTPAWDGVALPVDRARWYASMVEWADAEHDRLVLERVTCAADADAAAEREAWWRGQAERPRVEPALLVGLGIVAGAGLTLGAAAGWGAVTGQ